MFQKDWLLRQLEAISAMVAHIHRLRTQGDLEGTQQTIDEAYRELFGLDARLAGIVPHQFLRDKISAGDRLDGHRGLALAVLLREDAQLQLDRGLPDEAESRLVGSLAVFLATAKHGALPPEHPGLYDAHAVLNQLDPGALPGEVAFDLFQFYEDEGEYASAEDVLHELIASSPAPHALIKEGIAFYEWLLTREDEELEAGNLPRAEVIEGLSRLNEAR